MVNSEALALVGLKKNWSTQLGGRGKFSKTGKKEDLVKRLGGDVCQAKGNICSWGWGDRTIKESLL